jgi:hypothetical protein
MPGDTTHEARRRPWAASPQRFDFSHHERGYHVVPSVTVREASSGDFARVARRFYERHGFTQRTSQHGTCTYARSDQAR